MRSTPALQARSATASMSRGAPVPRAAPGREPAFRRSRLSKIAEETMRSSVAHGARAIAVAACAVMLVPQATASQQGGVGTTVILVRHAEKQSTGDDPSLTEVGRARARELAHVLGEAGIAAVYSTPYARTRETAQPLATALGLDVIERPADHYGTDMAEWIRAHHAGEVVVAVSHSNTVPALIEALGATPVPTIEEHEYDGLYVVTIDASGNATLLALRYGAETPDPDLPLDEAQVGQRE